MQWYLAKIIFRIICGHGDHTAQFDEQVRLVAAHNDDHALDKANEIGMHEATCFYNQQQQLVQWKFVAITELYKVNELIDGAELFSKIHEADDAENYMELAHRRASFVKQYNSNQHLQLVAAAI